MQEQLATSLHATYLEYLVLCAIALMDVEKLHNDILSALPSDPVAQVWFSDTSDSWWSVDDTGFLCLDGRIYVPDSNDLHLRVLRFKHDHPLSSHFSQNRTLELIWHEYTWPGLRTFVKDYVQSCTTCAWAKVPCHWPYGLLKQLPVPEKPWNSILMDFIEQLPASTSFTAILVVVNWLSKQAIFIPTHDTITAPELAKLFLMHVFSKHGVPAHVTSDQGSEFVSHFFWSLGKALDMCLHFTSGYHPEGDVQCISHHQQLRLHEVVYLSSFISLVVEAHSKESIYHHPSSAVLSTLSQHSCLHLPLKFPPLRFFCSPGSVEAHHHLHIICLLCWFWLVFTTFPHFDSHWPSKKLSEKNLGPYPIVAQASSHLFTLCLPDSMHAVHPVFHVSQLEPAIPNTIPNWSQPPPPLVDVDGDLEFKVSEILDSKVNQHRKCWLQYLVWWTGYEGTDEETTWVLATELDNASELVQEYHDWYPDKPGPFKK
ncbi:hypothetical protein M404DRAFT_136212 [Pisolithus tinctorius Marx 270]|uniref:Chromo domain-containing protein n=1 Tax=Pisolithus tinctorius Marx 270 TaxID=870435 RepID=A0A0C3KCQ1_PISTI|nr:hypothetical protein M404DRAFT_136212 [Pisolithus tinctorius Marx 270]